MATRRITDLADLEEILGVDLTALRGTDTTGASIENRIGAISVPLGMAGPLVVIGSEGSGEVYLPLATSEAALVASVSRGCKAVNASGGATAHVYGDGMTRAPLFDAGSVHGAERLVSWTVANLEELQEAVATKTSHGKLHGVLPLRAGRLVWLRFEFTTGDAMGMNMVTLGTRAACERIVAATGAQLIALSGNACTDKKPAAINAILGRGKSVAAEVRLPEEVVVEVLKTTPAALVAIQIGKNLLGGARAGVLGANAHHANIIAALFLATGQDPAQIGDSAVGITDARVEPDGSLYFAVDLPVLPIGTVGGGTGLPTAAACLRILGCQGAGRSRRLAEVIAAAVLAGELSLMAAIASDDLASTHERLREVI